MTEAPEQAGPGVHCRPPGQEGCKGEKIAHGGEGEEVLPRNLRIAMAEGLDESLEGVRLDVGADEQGDVFGATGIQKMSDRLEDVFAMIGSEDGQVTLVLIRAGGMREEFPIGFHGGD